MENVLISSNRRGRKITQAYFLLNLVHQGLEINNSLFDKVLKDTSFRAYGHYTGPYHCSKRCIMPELQGPFC